MGFEYSRYSVPGWAGVPMLCVEMSKLPIKTMYTYRLDYRIGSTTQED